MTTWGGRHASSLAVAFVAQGCGSRLLSSCYVASKKETWGQMVEQRALCLCVLPSSIQIECIQWGRFSKLSRQLGSNRTFGFKRCIWRYTVSVAIDLELCLFGFYMDTHQSLLVDQRIPTEITGEQNDKCNRPLLGTGVCFFQEHSYQISTTQINCGERTI